VFGFFFSKTLRYRLTLKFEGLKLVNINTDGISSLPKLTDKQKILQETRIAKEKAKALEEKRLAEEKTKHAEQEKIKAKESLALAFSSNSLALAFFSQALV
jgi:outer membrane protein assembly factor BamE